VYIHFNICITGFIFDLQVASFRFQVAGSRLQVPGCRFQVPGSRVAGS